VFVARPSENWVTRTVGIDDATNPRIVHDIAISGTCDVAMRIQDDAETFVLSLSSDAIYILIAGRNKKLQLQNRKMAQWRGALTNFQQWS
jgi:hypothetical protein